MRARLYSNENFPLPVVELLKRFRHDVIATRDVGKDNEGIPDEDVLRFAVENRRAVLTHNRRDFIHLHRQQPQHEGIIVCTDNADFSKLAAKIHALLDGLESLAGQLVRVNHGD
jgi:predicted nuclease of predicted toxin-antitoxin system